MTDQPIPDDLIDRLAQAIDPAGWATLGEGAQAAYRLSAQRVLTALAEWADGALIDPDGWRRLDAKVAHRWHHAYGPDGAVLCNHPDTDFCSDPDRGEWTDYLHALTERETTP